jgi:hypothetical protein
MSFMEPSTTGPPPVSEPPSADVDETFFKTPNAPPGYHFEQMTLPGLIGPDFLIPASVSKLFRKLFRRASTHS